MVKPPHRPSTSGRDNPLRAAGIRRRSERSPRTRLPLARRLFTNENIDLEGYSAPLDYTVPLSPSRGRPQQNPSATVREEERPRPRTPSPNYSPILDHSNLSYSPVQDDKFSSIVSDEQHRPPSGAPRPTGTVTDEEFHELLNFLGSDELLDSLIDGNNQQL